MTYRFVRHATISARPQGRGCLKLGMQAVTMEAGIEAVQGAAMYSGLAALAHLWILPRAVK